MTKKLPTRIPVNLIAGPLGVGKTTTINHLLKERPENEQWAVLVNEYGLIGLDAALMDSESEPGQPPGVDIREVAGGCICCSAGLMFEVSLVTLLRRQPDRLLIEPTGLAALSGILDTLDRPGIREAIDVQSVICLMDPKRFDQDLRREETRDQVEAADILLASRRDLATQEHLEAFNAWGESLFPKKKLIGEVERGKIPLELLNLVSMRQTPVSRGGHAHGTDHQHEHEHEHDHHHPTSSKPSDESCDASRPILRRSHRSTTASTVGWICWGDLVFDAKRTSSWLQELTQLPGLRRIKAVLRSNEGWCSYNFIDGIQTIRHSGYRRDSRLELIFEGDAFPDVEELERALKMRVIEFPHLAPTMPPPMASSQEQESSKQPV